MGAFDTYEGHARCPSCAAEHWPSGQTKFFVPDFAGQSGRHFVAGVVQPLDFAASELAAARVWDGSWLRTRAPAAVDRVDLLVDFDELFGCSCGATLALILRFDLPGPASAALRGCALWPALGGGVAGRCDFVNGEDVVEWTGDVGAFLRAVEALGEEAEAVRAAAVEAALGRRFPPGPWIYPSPFATVVAPCRCEACGEVVRRRLWVALGHPDHDVPLFGPAWEGGILRPGDAIASDHAWLSDDVDRSYFVRVRHPTPRGRLVVAGMPESWGCRCGAGRATTLLHFAVEPGRVRLREVTMRAIRRAADLEGIDFAYAPGSSRAAPRSPWRVPRPTSREAALEDLAREWRLAP